MIKFSRGMVPCIVRSAMLQAGQNKFFAVLGGSDIPTKAEIQAILDTNATNNESFDIGVKQVLDIDPATALRTEIQFGSDFVANQLNANFFRFEASKRSEDFTNHSVGDGKWFVFAITSGTSLNENAETPMLFIGTVGDPDSDNADVVIVDTLVGNSTNYLLNDLEISYKV